MALADPKKEAIREAVHADSFQYGTKQRFGLFSNPVSTAVGDTNFSVPVKPRRDEDGAVITEARNFYTTKMKTGKTDSQLFSRPSYVSTGDPFKQVAKMSLRTTVKDGHIKAGHDKAFVPAKHTETAAKKGQTQAAYEYMPNPPGPRKKTRDDDGVIVGPRNMLTTPIKVGKVGPGTTLGGVIPYMEDDYNAKKKIAEKDREYHLSKVQEKPFSQKAKQKYLFNSNREVYEENPPIPRQKTPEKVVIADEDKLHDKPFKPANPPKKGTHCTLEKFPQYLPNPPKEIKRKVVSEDEETVPGFKCTTRFKARPTPSVATNFRNLKAQFPSAFKR